ncbi:MAG: recombination-associated protein RdgC [Colwellia sp.]|nr:recombination-associated protein RdgC [Colwellia sp.]
MTELNTGTQEAVEFTPKQELAKLNSFVVYQFQVEEDSESCLNNLTEEVLLENVFKPCGSIDQFKVGFSPFVGEGSNFILKTNGSTLFQITSQEKKPHGALVKRKCKEAEAKFMKENELEKLDKEQKALIKDTVVRSLLPETSPEDPKTALVWIKDDKLIVGAGTYNKAEEFVCLIRSVLGSCPVEPLQVEADVADKMTSMLDKGYDETIVLQNLVHLNHEQRKGVVKYEKEDIYSVDPSKHLKEGFKVSKMQMSYDLLVDFTLDTELQFTQVKSDKDFLQNSKDIAALIITVGGINQLVNEVVKVFK